MAASFVTAEGLIKDGVPGKVIVKEAKEWGADLIVIGASTHGRLQRMVTEDIPQYVFSHAPCSVEVVHEEESNA